MKHFLSIDDFTTSQVETVLDWARHIESGWGHCRSMNNKCISCFFSEPSTRTRFSFERAMHWLGGRVITAADASASSSLKKGETLKDTIRTLGQYSDAIVMRHGDPEWPEVAREYSRVPVINAGSGPGEHPTQALLDLHTIRQKYKSLSGLKVMFCGDIANSRTIHSLMPLLKMYGCNLYCCPAERSTLDCLKSERLGSPSLALSKDGMEKYGCTHVGVDDANDIIGEVDVFYMTRIQLERLKDPVAGKFNCFSLDGSNIGMVKRDATILHPLPRGSEISPELDDDPRADYHERQVRNGLYVRTALLDYVLYGNPIINRI